MSLLIKNVSNVLAFLMLRGGMEELVIQGIYHIYKPERHKKFFLTKQKPIPAKARMGNSPLKRISALAELRRATSGLQTVLGPKKTGNTKKKMNV